YGSFQYFVARFFTDAKRAFDAGDLPRTPENRKALEDLEYLRSNLLNTLSHGDRETLPIVAQIKESVRAVNFGDSLSMRPEATASVVRAYIEHGMNTLPGNVKLYYMGPMF